MKHGDVRQKSAPYIGDESLYKGEKKLFVYAHKKKKSESEIKEEERMIKLSYANITYLSFSSILKIVLQVLIPYKNPFWDGEWSVQCYNKGFKPSKENLSALFEKKQPSFISCNKDEISLHSMYIKFMK